MERYVKYKVAFVDSRTSKVLSVSVTKPISLQSKSLDSFLESYKHYLLTRPYTRLIITPLVDVDSGELFTNLKDSENV